MRIAIPFRTRTKHERTFSARVAQAIARVLRFTSVKLRASKLHSTLQDALRVRLCLLCTLLGQPLCAEDGTPIRDNPLTRLAVDVE